MNSNKKKLHDYSKEELIQLIDQIENKFADSNAHAAELVVELEEKNLQLQSTQEMLEKMAFIGELAAGVGHEINNPLTICIGKLDQLKECLEQKSSMSAEIEEIISTQNIAFQRIAQVVEGLRNYSHHGTSKIDIIDIHEAILSTIKLTGSMYEKSGIDIRIDLKADDHHVRGSLGKIQQVVINFLTNARDALESTTAEKVISISTKSENSQFFLTVKDNGCGIKDSIKEKVFENFFTTKPMGKGTGLGLNITGKIIKEMNGSIEIGPSSESGAEFIVTLPTTDKPKPVSNVNTTAFKTTSKKKFSGKVLVVDDEIHIRQILSKLLTFYGFDVSQAENGLEGLKAIESENFDVVFSDMTMPKMSGEAFISKAKQILAPQCKVYVLTGGVLGSQQQSAKKIESLVDGFLMKPFDKDGLYDFLEKSL